MALVLKDRVKETSTTAGTGTITLAGAVAGFQSFSAVGNGNTTYYAIVDSTTGDWEVGIGTYTSSGTTLSRTTVLSSSNGGSLVPFAANPKDVFVTYPSEKSVYEDASNVVNATLFGAITATSAALTTGTVSTTPAANTDIANKQYVDGLVTQGISYHEPVYVESPNTAGNLNALYNQPGGAGNGVGATLTNNGTKAALTIDGILMTTTKRVLIYNQTNAFENGVYTVTTVGTPDPGGTNWVLTRSTDADTYGLRDPDSLGYNDAFFVTNGNTGAGETYVCTTTGVITFGSTNITFAQISSAQVYTAGTGLNLSPATTFNISNTGVSANTYGSASAVPVFAVNAQGQITGVTNTNIAINGSAVSGNISGSAGSVANALTLGTYLTGGTYNGSAAVTATVDATSANTASKVVARDSSGNFSAGTITATLSGSSTSATTATNLAGGAANQIPYQTGSGATSFITAASGTNTVLNFNGSTFSWSAGTISGVPLGSNLNSLTAGTYLTGTAYNGSAAQTWTVNAASANTASTVVARDASGNFSASTITASLSGNATSATNSTTTSQTNFSNLTIGSSQVLYAGNYNSYAPTLTGTGASGTWGINVTGSAATATTASNANTVGGFTPSQTAGVANRVVVANASGYIFNTYFNSSDDTSSTGLTYIMAKFGDDYIRSASAAKVATFISGQSMNIAGNATTTSQTNFSNLTIGSSQVLYAGNYNSYAPTLTGTGASGTWSINVTGSAGNAATATALSSGQSNWSGTGVLNNVVGMLAWKNYGNSHVIFDASNGTSPSGGGVSNTNATVAWSAAYPTLMGWNGSTTYGVRVDSARISDSTSGSAGSVDFANLTNKGSGTGTYTTSGDYRAPIFYDSNDTAFYTDPNSTSSQKTILIGYASGTVYDVASSGVLTFGSTSDIPNYSIQTALESYSGNYSKLRLKWYTGIQYYASQAYGGHRFYDIDGTQYFGIGVGGNWSYSIYSHRAPIFYDLDNTGYYVDPASTTYLYSLQLSGSTYFRPNNWIQLDGDYGIYNTVYNGAHFLANASSSYGAWRMIGSRGSYGGIYDTYSGVTTGMFDSAGNGGFYREANGRWYQFYNISNDCTGFGTSTTASGYNIYCGTGIYSGGRVDGTIFYDANNTGYYVDPASTSNLNNVQIVTLGVGTGGSGTTGEIRATANVTAYYSSDIKFKTNVRDIPNAIETVESIGGKLFDWTNEYIEEHGGEDGYFIQKEDFGVIAQDVLKVFPVAVRTRPDGSLAVDYEKLSALAFAAVASLSTRVKSLEARI